MRTASRRRLSGGMTWRKKIGNRHFLALEAVRDALYKSTTTTSLLVKFVMWLHSHCMADLAQNSWGRAKRQWHLSMTNCCLFLYTLLNDHWFFSAEYEEGHVELSRHQYSRTNSCLELSVCLVDSFLRTSRPVSAVLWVFITHPFSLFYISMVFFINTTLLCRIF